MTNVRMIKDDDGENATLKNQKSQENPEKLVQIRVAPWPLQRTTGAPLLKKGPSAAEPHRIRGRRSRDAAMAVRQKLAISGRGL
jgi:hypothetical protein